MTEKMNEMSESGDQPFRVVHYMDEYLLDACVNAERDEPLYVTPVVEDVTCTACGRITRSEKAES